MDFGRSITAPENFDDTACARVADYHVNYGSNLRENSRYRKFNGPVGRLINVDYAGRFREARASLWRPPLLSRFIISNSRARQTTHGIFHLSGNDIFHVGQFSGGFMKKTNGKKKNNKN